MVNELHSMKSATHAVLKETAKQATVLASGLQNAAPPQAAGPGKSVLYLNETAAQLEELCRSMDASSVSLSSSED